MIEHFLMEVSRTNSYDTYTCSVLEQPFWECLDIASARTLSGSYKNSEIYNVSSNLDVLQQASTQLTDSSMALFGRLGEQIDTTSSNFFGAEAACQDSASGGKNYGVRDDWQ